MDSILSSIKQLLGIEASETSFDVDIIIHINSAFSVLQQLGVGPSAGFLITGTTELWSSYSTDLVLLNIVKLYIFLKTKVVFDPPANSTILQAYNSSISEHEFRAKTHVENTEAV